MGVSLHDFIAFITGYRGPTPLSSIAVDTGIPVPDLHKLFPEAGSPILAVAQQHMPGPSNTPQHFDRFDADLPFFVDFPFGYRVQGANWFAADGIPILPIDDNGNDNAYPLMRVQAIVKDADPIDPANVLASVDVVLPVASEADCQLCHAVSDDPAMTELGFTGNGAASDMSGISFDTILAAAAPGTGTLNKLQNAAKINVLRLHDVKHGTGYESWPSAGPGPLTATPCNATDNPNNAGLWNENCIVNQAPVQCSQCHYSPALDLAQAGPVDEPEQGPRGRQQRHHISQSRAMHGHHGPLTFMGSPLFPDMPPPNDANGVMACPALTLSRRVFWKTPVTPAIRARTPSVCAVRCCRAVCYVRIATAVWPRWATTLPKISPPHRSRRELI